MRWLILLAACLQSCTVPAERIEVDTAKRELRYGTFRAPVEISPKGIGDKLGSNKTPVGSFTVSKEPHHRYGPVLRLSGYQGNRRGILIHRDMTRSDGTHGCVALTADDMRHLFAMVPDGEELVIY